MENFNLVEKILIWAIPIIFAITLHEAAHGYVAYKYGDDTAKKLGRISINPLKHVDIVGTFIVPIIMIVSTNFIFGWAKPVPVDARKLKKPKQNMAVVALAGPLSNFLMAIFWVLLLKVAIIAAKDEMTGALVLAFMCQAGILINIVLMVLNILPIPPLDGSKILAAFLPPPIDRYFHQASLVGLILVVALLVSGLLGKIMFPMINGVQHFLFVIFGIT